MPDFPAIDPLDRRLNAYRPEIADHRLQGKVEAARFVAGEDARIIVPVADLRRDPGEGFGIEHQLLLGEAVRVFERKGGWAWLQCIRDSYVGWTQESNLGTDMPEPTHLVCVPRTFVYPDADLKLPVARSLSMGSGLTIVGEVENRGVRYSHLSTGEAVIAGHVRPVSSHDPDFVSIACKFRCTPYLWGGSSGFGLDCSGLVELAMRMAGFQVLRDSDLQAATIGAPFDPGADYRELQRGDLIFWRGHVAIAEGDGNLLHANGYSMDVSSEPVPQALARIAAFFEKPIGCRRPGKPPPQ